MVALVPSTKQGSLLGTMNVRSKFHGYPSNVCGDVSVFFSGGLNKHSYPLSQAASKAKKCLDKIRHDFFLRKPFLKDISHQNKYLLQNK